MIFFYILVKLSNLCSQMDYMYSNLCVSAFLVRYTDDHTWSYIPNDILMFNRCRPKYDLKSHGEWVSMSPRSVKIYPRTVRQVRAWPVPKTKELPTSLPMSYKRLVKAFVELSALDSKRLFNYINLFQMSWVARISAFSSKVENTNRAIKALIVQ